MNKPLTANELDTLIEEKGEIEVYIETYKSKGKWAKLTHSKNYPLNSYSYVDNENTFRVRRLINMLWRPWLVAPKEEETKEFSWKERDKIKKPVPCPFCDAGFPMTIGVDYIKNFNMYEGFAKCDNCKKEIHLNGYLFSVDEVYQEIYRVCADKK